MKDVKNRNKLIIITISALLIIIVGGIVFFFPESSTGEFQDFNENINKSIYYSKTEIVSDTVDITSETQYNDESNFYTIVTSKLSNSISTIEFICYDDNGYRITDDYTENVKCEDLLQSASYRDITYNALIKELSSTETQKFFNSSTENNMHIYTANKQGLEEIQNTLISDNYLSVDEISKAIYTIEDDTLNAQFELSINSIDTTVDTTIIVEEVLEIPDIDSD